MAEPLAAAAAGSRPPCALELAGVHKSFGATPIIRGVSLEIARGERHAIIGPNGAGKSTLFNLISGRFAPTRGSIRLKGEEIAGKRAYRIDATRPRAQLPGDQHLPAPHRCYENIRCGVLWSLGYRYDFLALRRPAARRQRAHRAHPRADPPDGAPRHARGRAHLCRAARARDRHHHRRRRKRDPARRAHGRHEPRRDRARGGADPLGHSRAHARHGRARHGRGLRPRRPHLRARVRAGHRHRHAGARSARTRPCSTAYLGSADA